ncbi:hypothetical protein LR48_Vigan06g121700 [Vigna angularis]|uniref:Uncharacterized protein n=1 Tax=Phaseolus angularis TaxID=3914 RepID=A0A0L9UT59_PHAAN|nr:hypothetical protein LR48_Vigan06g121700 [Vigna angularis]
MFPLQEKHSQPTTTTSSHFQPSFILTELAYLNTFARKTYGIRIIILVRAGHQDKPSALIPLNNNTSTCVSTNFDTNNDSSYSAKCNNDNKIGNNNTREHGRQGSFDLLEKKKIKRSRKYDAYGNLKVSGTLTPAPPGFTLSIPSEFSKKRGCGKQTAFGIGQPKNPCC